LKNLYLVLFGIFFSANLFAQTWNDISVDQTYVFEQLIKLPISKKSSMGKIADLIINKGDKFTVSQIQALDYIKVVVLVGEIKPCANSQITSLMEIVKVENKIPATDVGMMLEEECKLSIFIESKELLNPHFFQISERQI
jgi:hypothetical protein